MVERPILVAVDFEEASRRALVTAQAIASGLRAPLALVHVYRVSLYTYTSIEPVPMPPPIPPLEVEEAARASLGKLAALIGVAQELTLVREGDPADEILEAARAIDARMIALGTHGRRGLAHILLGSVAEQVMRRSPVPVLTVRVSG
jgi:nucleotide-binding universal stress UspA family protein